MLVVEKRRSGWLHLHLSPEGDCPLLSISSPFIIIRGELGAGGGGKEEWVVMKWN